MFLCFGNQKDKHFFLQFCLQLKINYKLKQMGYLPNLQQGILDTQTQLNIKLEIKTLTDP